VGYTTSYVCLVILWNSVSLTMSMNYVYSVLSCFLHRRYLGLSALLQHPHLRNHYSSSRAGPISFDKYDPIESQAFVTYIITNATVSTPPLLMSHLIVLSVKCRTGELGTLPNNLLDSIQEISFSCHFSS
jgi:hypothetical protein